MRTRDQQQQQDSRERQPAAQIQTIADTIEKRESALNFLKPKAQSPFKVQGTR